METWVQIATYAKDICSIVTCLALLIKPARDWLTGAKETQEGLRCLLRSEIVRIYYRHRDVKQLREYEYKNLV